MAEVMYQTSHSYRASDGSVLYDVIRKDLTGGKKTFSPRRVGPDGEYIYNLDGIDRIPYNLPLLLKGIEHGETIYFVEGEKCADALVSAGLVATTRSEGSGAELSEPFLSWFRGASEIIVIVDSDVPGRKSGVSRAGKLSGVSLTRICDLAPSRTDGYDVADFLAEGKSIGELAALVQSSPVYNPPKVEKPKETTNGVQAAKIFTLADLLRTAVSRTEDAVENGPRIQPSPWSHLNLALGGGRVPYGFSPTETVIWAAVPGGGKSAATWMVADHAAANHEGTAVLASIEMGEIDAVQRLISLYSGVTTAQLRSGQLASEEWERLAYTEKHLANRRLAIIGRDGRDLSALKKSIDALASKTRISCIVLDHLGKIAQGKSTTRNRNEATEDVIEALANLAIEYDCVVHVVQHLNRLGYGARPTLANLRDGGNTEGHANIVIFPYRRFPADKQLERRESGELILEKCRDGAGQALPMKYVGERYMWVEAESPTVWFERG